MKTVILNAPRMVDLLYQALETEKGGVQVYTTALRCVQDEGLREEWNEYLEQTKAHVQVVAGLLEAMNLDVDAETPGRRIVRHLGVSLVKAMEMALRGPDLVAAQLVAAECVTLAETKDHLNWELIGQLAGDSDAGIGSQLGDAFAQVKPQESEHLYHTQGWSRELWIDALGMPAVLPPPEETEDVKSALEAAKAKNSRTRAKQLKGA